MSAQPFTLWLEFELFTSAWDKSNEACNVNVTLADGRRYGLNVWTYKFLTTLVGWDAERHENLDGLYQIPPDLFVQELTRECIEATIADLLQKGDLDKILNPTVLSKPLNREEE